MQLSLLALSNAHASPAKEQTIEKLMQVSDFKNLITEANNELKPVFDAQAQALLKDALNVKTLDEKQLVAANQISALMFNMSSEILEDAQFYSMVKTSFKNTFTEEEAQANIQFLSTPIGQSINKKSVVLMGDIMKQTQTLAAQIFQDPAKKEHFMQSMGEILQPILPKKASN